MNVSFHGACREVTGSCILIESDGVRFLVDCGVFQGRKFALDRNAKPFDFDPRSIDFVILTHAHLDHCGRLPKLYREGFRGQVFSTAPTRDFAEIILLDSARIIYAEAMLHKKKPLYYDYDVIGLMNLFEPLQYGKEKKVSPRVRIRLQDAGHILGSAISEVWIKNDEQEEKLVFSGDLGNPPVPLLKDTAIIKDADYLFVESTYGDRVHESKGERRKLLKEAILGSVGRSGTLMIPAFALERTQEVLYELNHLVETGKVPAIPIFVDSPLAIKATEIYKKYSRMYDKESRALIESGDDLFNFPGLEYTRAVQQSKKINRIRPPKVILAGSGMCIGGRIPHHLKFNLGDPNSHLLIISYQVAGSLGRRLFEGAKQVTIMGQRVNVKAKVSAIGSYSSHADQFKLLKWIKHFNKSKLKKVFIIHGEEKAGLALATEIRKGIKANTTVPEYTKKYNLSQ
jgi:metallo-beta-lactamase family protein